MKQLYFAHDYDAKSDPKLQNLMMEMGLEGVGLYWCVVEDLYSEGGYLPMSMIKTLSWRYRIDEKKVDSLIRKFDLFTIDEEGSFTSNSVLRRLEKVSEISEKRKKAIKKRWEKLTKEVHMNNNSNSNEIQSKEKESKEDKSKEDESKVKEIKEKESKEEYDEDESSSSPRIKYDDFVKKYNNWAKENGFPNVKALTDARRKKIKSIVSDFDLDMIDKVLSICSSSDFLNGGNDRNWHADFDFIFTKSKFIKILEGSYSKEQEGDCTNHSDEISMKLKEWAEEN